MGGILSAMSNVEDVDPYTNVSVSYKIAPSADWRPGVIQVHDDYTQQKYELARLQAGHWLQKGEVGIERMAIERFGIPDGKFNSAFVRVTPYSAEHAKEVATAIKDHLARQSISVGGINYQDPNQHWGRSFFDGINLVLRLLAILSVVSSAVLVLKRDIAEKNNFNVGEAVTLNATTKNYNEGTLLYVRTTAYDAGFRSTMTTQLKSVYEGHKYHIAQTLTENEARQTNEFGLRLLIMMLMALSVIVAGVGGIAVTGALSISVVERAKEIGVSILASLLPARGATRVSVRAGLAYA
jgi:hypothetical protein